MKPNLWTVVIIGLLLLSCQAGVELLSNTPTFTPTIALPTLAPTFTALPTLTMTVLPKSEVPAQPPTVTPMSDWNTYRNETHRFELQYPAGGVLTVNLPDNARIDLPFLAGTNLEEKYLEIQAQPAGGMCLSSLAQNLPPDLLNPELLLMNNLEYTVIKGSEGAAGNRYDWVSYAIQDEDTCVTLDFVLHSVVAENYPTPPPLFDVEIESRVFAEIAATFTWLAP